MDRWGVPHNMFGAIGEDFYGLVGRIVLVSALLENRLHVLFCALASAPEEERAGEPGTELAKAPVEITSTGWRSRDGPRHWMY